MAANPGTLIDEPEKTQGVSSYLDLFEKAPSEHAKTAFIRENLVPWIQSKGSLAP